MASLSISLHVKFNCNLVSRSLDSPPLEGEADGEDGAEEHREPDDEGEDDGVLTFHVQRGGEVCKGCNK